MEPDNQLKKILAISADKTSADFTNMVMKQVQAVSKMPTYYQPLVRSTVKRIFVFTFAALVGIILFLCFIISAPPLPAVDLKEILFRSHADYDKILIFILLFWIVFISNRLIERKKFFA